MRKWCCAFVGQPLNHIHQDTKSAQLIAVCKLSLNLILTLKLTLKNQPFPEDGPNTKKKNAQKWHHVGLVVENKYLLGHIICLYYLYYLLGRVLSAWLKQVSAWLKLLSAWLKRVLSAWARHFNRIEILHICNRWILLRKIVVYLVGRKFHLHRLFCC